MRMGIVVAIAMGLATVGQGQSTNRSAQWWNDTFTEYEALQVFEKYPPNQFLSTILDARVPGQALDIAMGQGRNALLMASRGWNVTGFDISDVAIGFAQAEAAGRDLRLKATVADGQEYDYGEARFDHIAAIYAHGLLIPRAADVVRALRPGGILVVEAPHRDDLRSGYRSNELLTAFDALTVLHYEEATGTPDQVWTPPGQVVRFVRLVGEKRSDH